MIVSPKPSVQISWLFCRRSGWYRSFLWLVCSCVGWSGFRSEWTMTGLALHADPTCVPSFRQDGRLVGAAWGVGWTWWWCCGAQCPQKSWIRSGTPYLFLFYFIFYSCRERIQGCGYDDFIEDLNAVDRTRFSHQLGLSHKSLQFCILESYSNKHTRVQFLNCGSHRQ